MQPPIRTLPEIAADLDQLYTANPTLVRIAPRWMRMIEACGGTFDFETGKVHIPPVDTTILTGTPSRTPVETY